MPSVIRAAEAALKIGSKLTQHRITSMENALVKAGQICSLYTKGAAKEGLKISCSIGMVFCESDDGAAFDDLYQKADSALYKAKEKGKNVFVVFDENML